LDWNYLNSLVSFSVGILSGFQAVYERYPTAPLAAACTLPGSVYLLTRGALPASIFAAMYHYKWTESYLFLTALALGVGAEAILRSQVLIRQSAKQGGGIDELLKGPLDLLRWYQDIFLRAIGERDARARLNFVKSNLPPGDFKSLCTRIQDNLGAFHEPIAGLEEAIKKLVSEFDADKTGRDKNERYRLKLGFTVLRMAGRQNFKTLFSNPLSAAHAHGS
jgi:hypothetical protein